MAPRLGPKGDARSRVVISVVFKIPEMHIPLWYWFRFRSIWEVAARWPDADRDALAHQRFGATGTVPRQEVGIDHLDRLVVNLASPKQAS